MFSYVQYCWGRPFLSTVMSCNVIQLLMFPELSKTTLILGEGGSLSSFSCGPPPPKRTFTFYLLYLTGPEEHWVRGHTKEKECTEIIK